MNGCGGHLGHATRIICINFGKLIRGLHMKFEINRLSEL